MTWSKRQRRAYDFARSFVHTNPDPTTEPPLLDETGKSLPWQEAYGIPLDTRRQRRRDFAKSFVHTNPDPETKPPLDVFLQTAVQQPSPFSANFREAPASKSGRKQKR